LVTHHSFVSEAGFAHVADLDEIAARDFSLSIPLYVKRNGIADSGKSKLITNLAL